MFGTFTDSVKVTLRFLIGTVNVKVTCNFLIGTVNVP